MEKNQQKNWSLSCEFSIFAQAYTGLTNYREIIDFLSEQDQIALIDGQHEFATAEFLEKIWNEDVCIQVDYILPNNGITCLEMLVSGICTELQCDCVEPESLLHEIINIIYK